MSAPGYNLGKHVIPLEALRSKVCVQARSNRDPVVDAIRGAAILLVVLGHGLQYSLGDGFQHNIVFRAIYSFHMPLFFAISGYLFKESDSLRDGLVRMRDRTFCLLVPYFLWTLIWHIFYMVSHAYFGTAAKGPSLWFLPVLLTCSWIHASIVLLSKGRGTAIVAMLGLSAILLMHATGSMGFWVGSVRYHYIFFWIGAIARRLHFNASPPCLLMSIAAGLLWFVLLPYWEFSSIPDWLRSFTGSLFLQRMLWLAFKVVVAMLGIYAVHSVIARLPRHGMVLLSCMGLHSIHIYLVHIGLVTFTFPYATPFGVTFWLFFALLLAVPILIATVVGHNTYASMLLFGRWPLSPRLNLAS